MYKFTGFMMLVAAGIVLVASLFPPSVSSIVGIAFAAFLSAAGTSMWKRDTLHRCEWVPDSDIDGWDWDEESLDVARYTSEDSY